jgi:transposase
MRGDDQQQDGMFSYISPDKRVPQDHPLRMIRSLVDGVLEQLSPRFNRLYARAGRPSIAPEKLLRALLLQMLYSVRSERLLMEQLDYNLLFRWFVGLSMDDEVWDASTFSKNRERLLEGDIAEAFFQGVLGWESVDRFKDSAGFSASMPRPCVLLAPCRSEHHRQGPDRRRAVPLLQNPLHRPEGPASPCLAFPVPESIACSGTRGAGYRDGPWS